MRLSIRNKLFAAFAVNLMLMIVLGVFAIVQLGRMNDSTSLLGDHAVVSLDLASEINYVVLRYRTLQFKHLFSTTNEEVRDTEQEMRTLETRMNTLLQEYRSLIGSAREDPIITRIQTNWEKFITFTYDELIPASQTNNRPAQEQAIANSFSTYEDLVKAKDELRNADLREAREATATAKATYESARVLVIGITLSALGLSLIVGFWLSTAIARNIVRLTAATTAVAGGDLERNAEVRSRDELGVLASAFNQMIASLRASRDAEAQARAIEMQRNEADRKARAELQRIVSAYGECMARVAAGDLTTRVPVQGDEEMQRLGSDLNSMVLGLHKLSTQVQQAVTNIASTAAEILAATTQQASASAEQSSAITQTTTTIEEIKVIAQQTAHQSAQVAQDSQTALQAARQGQQSVEATVSGMSQIRQRVESIAQTILSLADQTQAIGAIITTVSELADQSNLLALNAAIEAARAGEQGKSFAVVAQHVRDLAERSKLATRQVRDILSEIQRATNAAVLVTEEGTKGVETGARLAGQAGDVIHHIAAEVENGAQANVQMAAAAQQQMAGMEQIAQAMSAIQQATTQSLASTRQAERAAQDLHTLAQSLQHTVANYRV